AGAVKTGLLAQRGLGKALGHWLLGLRPLGRVAPRGPGVVGHDAGQQQAADDRQTQLQCAHKKRFSAMRCAAHAQPLMKLARPMPGTPNKGRPAVRASSPRGEGAMRLRGAHISAMESADSMSTATMRETPCSCMVTPISCSAISIAILLWLMNRNCVPLDMLDTSLA